MYNTINDVTKGILDDENITNALNALGKRLENEMVIGNLIEMAKSPQLLGLLNEQARNELLSFLGAYATEKLVRIEGINKEHDHNSSYAPWPQRGGI